MILYHGSNQDFSGVDLSKTKNRRDFGKGFYTTTIKEQAQQWGYTMFNRLGGDGIFLYEYEFSPGPAQRNNHSNAQSQNSAYKYDRNNSPAL